MCDFECEEDFVCDHFFPCPFSDTRKWRFIKKMTEEEKEKQKEKEKQRKLEGSKKWAEKLPKKMDEWVALEMEDWDAQEGSRESQAKRTEQRNQYLEKLTAAAAKKGLAVAELREDAIFGSDDLMYNPPTYTMFRLPSVPSDA
jgi:N-acetylmuramoyl-L-alanine amidase CwlA